MDKPTLIVLEVERGLRLLCGAEQLTQLLIANNLVEAARVVSVADAIGLSSDCDWIGCALEDLLHAADANPKIRSFERSPRE